MDSIEITFTLSEAAYLYRVICKGFDPAAGEAGVKSSTYQKLSDAHELVRTGRALGSTRAILEEMHGGEKEKKRRV